MLPTTIGRRRPSMIAHRRCDILRRRPRTAWRCSTTCRRAETSSLCAVSCVRATSAGGVTGLAPGEVSGGGGTTPRGGGGGTTLRGGTQARDGGAAGRGAAAGAGLTSLTYAGVRRGRDRVARCSA